MGKAKHTPGPWRAERAMLDGNEWIIHSSARNLPPFGWCPRLSVGIPPLHGYVGRGATEGKGEDTSRSNPIAIGENEANARLIAAAPETYRLLDNLIEALEIEGHPHDLDRCGCELCEAFKAAREHVRAYEKGKA